jgi:hypothetical protein
MEPLLGVRARLGRELSRPEVEGSWPSQFAEVGKLGRENWGVKTS